MVPGSVRWELVEGVFLEDLSKSVIFGGYGLFETFRNFLFPGLFCQSLTDRRNRQRCPVSRYHHAKGALLVTSLASSVSPRASGLYPRWGVSRSHAASTRASRELDVACNP